MKSVCVIFVLLSPFVCYVASAATGDVVEPCGSNNIDIECVRQYFEENGDCSVVCQPDEAPVSKERGVSYIPLVNASAIDVNSTLRNLNGPIRKFYVNNTSGNLVYSMNMNNVSYYSPAFTLYLHQMDGEPLIVGDEITETFPETVLTAVIPLDNSKITIKSMLESTTTAYFLSESGATLSIGPNIAENDDATAVIQEPCGSSGINKECVIQYFAEHSSCSVVSQSDDGPVLKERGVFHLPVVDTTAIDRNATLNDLDGPIRKFYINKKTGNLIYSMKMTNVSYYCPSFTFYFHRMDEEPLILTDDFNETYPHTVLTAIIPLKNGRVTQESLLESKVSAFFLPEGNVTMSVGAKFIESEEPVVQAALAGIMNNRLTAYKEAFVTEAPLRFRAYLQKYICDFDLPIKI